MIKADKDKLTVGGEIEVVMAEYMCITAYMLETFGTEAVVELLFNTYAEVRNAN